MHCQNYNGRARGGKADAKCGKKAAKTVWFYPSETADYQTDTTALFSRAKTRWPYDKANGLFNTVRTNCGVHKFYGKACYS